jgi:hypothetical protein
MGNLIMYVKIKESLCQKPKSRVTFLQLKLILDIICVVLVSPAALNTV